MSYYSECVFCGGALDPNEKCDCRDVRLKQSLYFQNHIKIDSKTRQASFILEDKDYEQKNVY